MVFVRSVVYEYSLKSIIFNVINPLGNPCVSSKSYRIQVFCQLKAREVCGKVYISCCPY